MAPSPANPFTRSHTHTHAGPAPAAGARAEPLLTEAEELLRVSPESADALSIRGFVRVVIEGRPEGIEDLDHAVANDPANWLARYYRSWSRAGAGDFDTAIRDMEKAWEVTPGGVGEGT